MKATLIFTFFLIILSTNAFASCLSTDELVLINQIATNTNTSNTTLANLLEKMCAYNNTTSFLNSSLINLTANVTNLTSFLNNYTNMTTANFRNITQAEFNATISNMTDEKLADFWTGKVLPIQEYAEDIDDTIRNMTDDLRNDSATKKDLNETAEELRNSISYGDSAMSLELSNKMLPVYIGLLALGAIFAFTAYKQKYPEQTRKRFLPLQGQKQIPQEMNTMENQISREEQKEMRHFITQQTDYSPTARAKVWLMYDDKQLDTKQDVLEQLELEEPKKERMARKARNDKIDKKLKEDLMIDNDDEEE